VGVGVGMGGGGLVRCCKVLGRGHKSKPVGMEGRAGVCGDQCCSNTAQNVMTCVISCSCELSIGIPRRWWWGIHGRRAAERPQCREH
jgi:hypothetical protein